MTAAAAPPVTQNEVSELAGRAREALTGAALCLQNLLADNVALREENGRLKLELAALTERYDALEEATPGISSILEQMRNIATYCQRHGLDYQAISAGRHK